MCRAHGDRPLAEQINSTEDSGRLYIFGGLGTIGQTVVSELCKELAVTRQTLYLHLGPDGALRQDGQNGYSGR